MPAVGVTVSNTPTSRSDTTGVTTTNTPPHKSVTVGVLATNKARSSIYAASVIAKNTSYRNPTQLMKSQRARIQKNYYRYVVITHYLSVCRLLVCSFFDKLVV